MASFQIKYDDPLSLNEIPIQLKNNRKPRNSAKASVLKVITNVQASVQRGFKTAKSITVPKPTTNQKEMAISSLKSGQTAASNSLKSSKKMIGEYLKKRVEERRRVKKEGTPNSKRWKDISRPSGFSADVFKNPNWKEKAGDEIDGGEPDKSYESDGELSSSEEED
jgi:hypothetical protein